MAIEIEKAHATYGASTAKRWLACPGSVALIEKAPPAVESPYAKEGTEAHACLEYLGKNRGKRLSAAAFLRKKYPLQMVIHAETALDEIERRLACLPGAELRFEAKLPLPVSEPGQFGTADVVIAEPFGRLIVMDYKYGAGIAVSPDENPQLIYYALCVAAEFDYNFRDVELVVIQPRAPVDGKIVRSWATTIENLTEWREKFEKGIRASKKKNAPLFSGNGEHCRFCPAAVICPEIREKKLDQAMTDFDDDRGTLLVPPKGAARGLSIRHLPRILAALPALEIWISAVREHAFSVAQRGERIEGFKLAEKRGFRKWNDEDEARASAGRLFGKDAFTEPSLLSPAQLERLGETAARFVKENTSTVSSGLTLVPESDNRKAVVPASFDFPG